MAYNPSIIPPFPCSLSPIPYEPEEMSPTERIEILALTRAIDRFSRLYFSQAYPYDRTILPDHLRHPAQRAKREIPPLRQGQTDQERLYRELLGKACFSAPNPQNVRVHQLVSKLDQAISPLLKVPENYPAPIDILLLNHFPANFNESRFAHHSKSGQIAISREDGIFLIETQGQGAHFHATATKWLLDSNSTSLTFNDEGDHLALGMANGEIEYWNLSTGTYSTTDQIEVDGRPAQFSSMAISKNRLIATTLDGVVFNLNLRRPQEVSRYDAPHVGPLCQVQFSPSGEYFAVSSNRGAVLVYKTDTFKVIKEFQIRRTQIRALAFHPSKPYIAFGGGTADPRIFVYPFLNTVKNPGLNIRTDSKITTLLWPKPNRLFSTHADGSHRVYPLKSGGNHVSPKILLKSEKDSLSYFTSSTESNLISIVDDGEGKGRVITYSLPVPPSKNKPIPSKLNPHVIR